MPNQAKENTTDQLQELFGGSFDSNQVITTKKNGVSTKLDKLRADILKDRKAQMAKHGNNIRFVTAKSIGKNDKGEVIRKAEILEGNFLFKLCQATKEIPLVHLKAVELDPTLSGTMKYYVTPKIEVINSKGEVTNTITPDDMPKDLKGLTS
tara:strand:+ start:54 stop:509 length:456 start_codon:yes stop_codon:yes gene_type:complete